ncbi:MAG: glycosyltransferase family 4 protein [Ferruginibacter sp.]|nr:glycosyltransferase family 4 protein [Ferruginibacter sp.]
MKPLIFLNSHPIQYFAPLYKQISTKKAMLLSVWYCSDESIKGKMDKGFGTTVKWDIPLLEGYHSVFIKNRSWKPSIHKGFFGLINYGIISLLYKQPRSVLVIHGWAYSTNIMAIVFGKLLGHTVCLRAETPLNQELKKNKAITFLKHIYLRVLFLFIDHFLYIGSQNHLFYQALGVPDKKLLFAPYCVDNDRFRNIYHTNGKAESRALLGLAPDKKIILYSGKYISKKRPMDLLMAFKELQDNNTLLIFVGEGELRPDMQSYIDTYRLSANVILTGFINQSKIPLYYSASDLFVMCSGLGETWGLSVNEAMNFGLPVIVSDTCGCAYDLIADGQNGAVFTTGNIGQLTRLLRQWLNKTPAEKTRINAAALEKIDDYSYRQVITALEQVTI